jgi:hypothetical protein
VPNPVYKPIEGGMTQMCNFAILAFNPTRSTGYAIDTQQKYRTDWICLHWSSEDSGLVPQEILERDLKRHGRESKLLPNPPARASADLGKRRAHSMGENHGGGRSAARSDAR